MSLESLIPQPIFKCWEYLQMVKNLFPRGPAWNFPIKPPLEEDAPEWVYLDTFFEQDFTDSNEKFKVYLDSMFRGDYTITTIGSTQVAAQRNPVKQGFITPLLQDNITGDFELEFGVQLPSTRVDNESWRVWLDDIGSGGSHPVISIYTHTTSGLSYVKWDYDGATDTVYIDFGSYDKIDFRVKRVSGRIRAFYRVNGGTWIKFIHDWFHIETQDTQVQHDASELNSISWTYMKFQDEGSFPCKKICIDNASPDWVTMPVYIEENYREVDDFNIFWAAEYKSRFTIDSYYGSGVSHSDTAALLTHLVLNDIALRGDFSLEFEIKLKDNANFMAMRLVHGFGNTPEAEIEWRAAASYVRFHDGSGGNQSSVSCSYWDGRTIKMKITREGSTLKGYHDIGEYPEEWTQFGTTQSYGADDLGIELNTGVDDQAITYFRFQSNGGFPKRIYSPGSIANSVWSDFLLIFACELARLQTDVRNLLKESIPGLSEDLLPEWERVAGIPDECSSLATTLSQRQQIVHAKITQAKGEFTGEFLPLTEEYFINYASSLNMEITITTDPGGVPFRVSHKTGSYIQRVTRMPESYQAGTPTERIDGSRLNRLGSLHRWDITVVSDPDGNQSLLECVFNRIKPAWTEINFV